MGLLADHQIERHVKIVPFCSTPSPPGALSYGLTAYGYDVRLGYRFKVFTNVYGAVVDPKGLGANAFVDVDLTPTACQSERYVCTEQIEANRCPACRANLRLPNHIVIPPNSFALGETVEYLEIPRDVLGVCVGKSTYARTGIVVNVTPLEPEWRGKITIEISNTTPLPAKVYANEGIAQILFFRGEEVCRTSYADKKGRYQDQKGLTLPFVASE